MNTDFKDSDRVGELGLIIYDGTCGVCSVFIGERKLLFEKYGFSIAALQEEWVEPLTGLSEATLLNSIHLFTSERKILKGVDFFDYLSAKIWWLTPLYLIFRVPLIKPLFSVFYTFIATRRRKISKVCGLQSRAKY